MRKIPEYLRHVKVSPQDRDTYATETSSWRALQRYLKDGSGANVSDLEKILVIKIEQGARFYALDKIRARLASFRRAEETRQLRQASE